MHRVPPRGRLTVCESGPNGLKLLANNVASELGLVLVANPDFTEIRVSAPPGASWELQASTDLVNWMKIPAGADLVEFPTSIAVESQFFRVLKR